MVKKNLSIYVHYPFCLRKCPYCDFVSYDNGKVDRDAYVAAIIQELRAFKETVEGEFQTATVYFGGGTPSLMSARQISAVVESVNRNFPIVPNAEITIEVNPATANETDMILWKSIGINRISLGVQSTSADTLTKLGRIHSVEEALNCYKSARETGFDSVGVDLIFGVPGQTLKEWKEDLARAIVLEPDHVSAYILKPPDGWRVPSEDELADMYIYAVETLESAGLRQYEVSNFARMNRESRHNLNYWKKGDYIGLGVAAHSCFDIRAFPQKAGGHPIFAPHSSDAVAVRWWNVINPEEYIEAAPEKYGKIEGFEYIDEEKSFNENLILALRLRDGISMDAFNESQKRKLEFNIGHLVGDFLAEKKNNNLRLTPKGLLLADEIAARLVAALDL